MKYEPVIGLEVHVQSKTKSKMFCSCSSEYFGSEPNTHTCPVCLGLPGALPVPNRYAMELCLKMALALNCSINRETKFDRKGYFYPDLPKGYQISQYDQPVGEKGYLECNIEGKTRKISITRVHQEEDTGKSIHEGTHTLLDFNKSGVPLIEIVSEPDMSTVEEVLAYSRGLRLLVRYVGVSDADMEKGQMRFELNLSLREKGSTGLPEYKVEVKNIGSISVLEKVVQGEIVRQSAILARGEVPVQETRGLVDMSGKTVSQRVKGTESDYGYFPEPDIPPIVWENSFIEKIRKSLPVSPMKKREVYQKYGLDNKTVEMLVSRIKVASFFDKVVCGKKDKVFIKEIAKILFELWSRLTEKKSQLKWNQLEPDFFVRLAEMSLNDKLSGFEVKKILECMTTNKDYWKLKSPDTIIETEAIKSIKDEDILGKVADKVVGSNPKAVKDCKNNPKAIMFLVGQVMREMKGKSDPNTVRKILESKIDS